MAPESERAMAHAKTCRLWAQFKAADCPCNAACPHTWNDGEKAWGCVLPNGHEGEHREHANEPTLTCSEVVEMPNSDD